jgi:hypothetical protein
LHPGWEPFLVARERFGKSVTGWQIYWSGIDGNV